uniref:Uncharacterized protein n=1 Tax=Kalanchoe fedtschenkoi TaxID=63787 RepID=A0A7N0ZVX4_KALFE
MGRNFSQLCPCFHPSATRGAAGGGDGHQQQLPDMLFASPEPLDETLGHSFCYVRSSARFLSPTPCDRFLSPCHSLRFSLPHHDGPSTGLFLECLSLKIVSVITVFDDFAWNCVLVYQDLIMRMRHQITTTVKSFGKAQELLEAVLKDPLLLSSQIDNSGNGHLLQLRFLIFWFLALKNLATVFLEQAGCDHYESALLCYLHAFDIDTKDSVVWNKLGTLTWSMCLLSISRWAFKQGKNCMEKLLEVLIAIGDEMACLSVADMILRRWPSHSRALHVKKTIVESEPIPFAPRGVDKLEPKHKKLTWSALADTILDALLLRNGSSSDALTSTSSKQGDIRLRIDFQSCAEKTNMSSRSMNTPIKQTGEEFLMENGTSDKMMISKEKDSVSQDEQPGERRSSRLERLRTRKPDKEPLDLPSGKDLSKVVTYLEPYIIIHEYSCVIKFITRTSTNYGAFHMGHMLSEEEASRGLLWQEEFAMVEGMSSNDASKLSDSMLEVSYHLYKIIESVALCFSDSTISSFSHTTDLHGPKNTMNGELLQGGSLSTNEVSFWVRFYWLSGQLSIVDGDKGKALEELFKSFSLLAKLEMEDAANFVPVPHCKLFSKLTVDAILHQMNLLKVDQLLKGTIGSLIEQEKYVECVNLLAPLLLSSQTLNLPVSVATKEDDGTPFDELSTLDFLIQACEKAHPLNLKVCLNSHPQKLHILGEAVGMQLSLAFFRPSYDEVESKTLLPSEKEPKEITNEHCFSHLLHEDQVCCFVDAAAAFFKLQHLHSSIPVKTQVDPIVAVHDLLAEYGICCASGYKGEEGLFLKLALKHLLVLDMKLKSSSVTFNNDESQCDKLSPQNLDGSLGVANTKIMKENGVPYRRRSDSSYEDDLAMHKNTTRGDYQSNEHVYCKYSLLKTMCARKTGLTKLRRVLRAIRKHFPKPPEDLLNKNVIDKFLDDPSISEDKLSDEAGSEPYIDVYCNLYYLLAQSEDMSATDKWPGFVEGEEFVEQNAKLYKYDLMSNPLHFESWQRLAHIVQDVVPSYDQRSMFPVKDATWRNYCENSMKHFKNAFEHEQDWSNEFYMGKLSDKLGRTWNSLRSFLFSLHVFSCIVFSEKYVAVVSYLHLITALKLEQYHTKDTVQNIFGSQTSRMPLDMNVEVTEANVEESKCEDSHLLDEAWAILYRDCLSALEWCVEGDLKHFHRTRHMLAKGFYLRGESGDLEKAKEELSFCFKSSRSSFTINMWEIDAAVKKGRHKTLGFTGNKRVLEYILFYFKLLEETKDIPTLDQASMSLKADKRFALSLEDLIPAALGRYVKALISSIRHAMATDPASRSSTESLLEKLFSLFIEQVALWPDICSLPEFKSLEYLHQYIHSLEVNVKLEALETIVEKIRRRCAKVCKHAYAALCQSLIISLALNSDVLWIDLRTEELWSSLFENPTDLKDLETKWSPKLSSIHNIRVQKVPNEDMKTREIDKIEIRDLSIQRKILLWAYTLLHGQFTSIGSVIKYCEENIKLKVKKGSGTPSAPSNSNATPPRAFTTAALSVSGGNSEAECQPKVAPPESTAAASTTALGTPPHHSAPDNNPERNALPHLDESGKSLSTTETTHLGIARRIRRSKHRATRPIQYRLRCIRSCCNIIYSMYIQR